ncbi:RNase adapter RapZ [Nocardiopsis sp. NPDC006198]|uniref:RapZ C-terminal domain-containing protein n=1 Tax=Nocardiopsis sp. NPDC006198 TaxID=3154472 RepID=UPI0033A55D04
MRLVQIISFGYACGPPPADAHLTLDLRDHFTNPAPHLPATAAFPDESVREHVMSTPGIEALAAAVTTTVTAYLTGPGDEPLVVAIGCSGGEHRAPTVASHVAALLHAHTVELKHRDLPDEDDEVDIDSPIEMPEGGIDFALPRIPRSEEEEERTRSRMEALISAWGALPGGFTAPQLAQALRDEHGLTRPRKWILGELYRMEAAGTLDLDDHGRWHPRVS